MHEGAPSLPWSEQPAQISPLEAANIERQLRSSAVERLLPCAATQELDQDVRQVVILEFSRHPKELMAALLASSPAIACWNGLVIGALAQSPI